jgi:hypothetical protein
MLAILTILVLLVLSYENKNSDMLHAVGFQQDEIKIVVGTIPDSDRHHASSIGDVIA